MRKAIAIIAVGSLLAIPLIGHVQQAPQEPRANRAASLAELQTLVGAQTDAIQALRKKVTALEARVKVLEEARAGGASR